VTDLIYDPALVETVATTLDLRAPNRDALDTLAQVLDGAEHGKLLVADLATGVGKTYIAAGLLDYLYGLGVRNVVIVTPGSTIQRKTVANLTPGQAKFVRGLQCRPTVITLDNFEKGAVAAAMTDPDEMKVFVFTVQSLLRPDTKENRRAHRDHETIGRRHRRPRPDRAHRPDRHAGPEHPG
jgi:type III restriction enzyme